MKALVIASPVYVCSNGRTLSRTLRSSTTRLGRTSSSRWRSTRGPRCDEQDCPGYTTEASPGSSRGQCFIVGDGGRLENKGQRSLNIQPVVDNSTELKSCFQIARVTRPLMSFGRLCDSGMSVVLSDIQAVVNDSEGHQVCVFERKPGGLYACKFRLKSPSPDFVRRG